MNCIRHLKYFFLIIFSLAATESYSQANYCITAYERETFIYDKQLKDYVHRETVVLNLSICKEGSLYTLGSNNKYRMIELLNESFDGTAIVKDFKAMDASMDYLIFREVIFKDGAMFVLEYPKVGKYIISAR